MKSIPLAFTPVKQSENHIQFLDPIRGAAIFLVFAYHCFLMAYWPSYGSADVKWIGWFRDFHEPLSILAVLPLTLGWAGVPIFFVVSGFCIHLSHERSQKKSWKIFFIRRFFRIYPPYLLALLIFSLAYPWTKLSFTTRLLHIHAEWFYSLAQLISHLLLAHNFNAVSVHGINGSFWTIAVEVQLYALYPLLYAIFRMRSPQQAFWIAGSLELGMRTFEALLIFFHLNIDIPAWFDYEPFIFWFSWSIGAVLAEAYLLGKSLPFRQSVLTWPLVMLICYSIKPLVPFCFTLSALSTATIISHIFTHGSRSPSGKLGLISKHFHFTGTVSYSAYLIHAPLLLAVPDVVAYLLPNCHFHAPMQLAICLMAWFPILVLSYLMYHFVELPSIALGKRVIRLAI